LILPTFLATGIPGERSVFQWRTKRVSFSILEEVDLLKFLKNKIIFDLLGWNGF
jgi:hypothetical protein